jgi:hypothetical protein
MEPGKAMCDHSWLFASSARSLVKLPIVGTEPRVRPVINHIGVTNVVRHCYQEKPGSILSLCNSGTKTADPLDWKQTVEPLDQWSEIAGPPHPQVMLCEPFKPFLK